MNNVHPVFDAATRLSRASVPGKTFQVRPTIKDGDWRLPRALHGGEPCIAMMDGSYRLIRLDIVEEAFWSLVSINFGEVAPSD